MRWPYVALLGAIGMLQGCRGVVVDLDDVDPTPKCTAKAIRRADERKMRRAIDSDWEKNGELSAAWESARRRLATRLGVPPAQPSILSLVALASKISGLAQQGCGFNLVPPSGPWTGGVSMKCWDLARLDEESRRLVHELPLLLNEMLGVAHSMQQLQLERNASLTSFGGCDFVPVRQDALAFESELQMLLIPTSSLYEGLAACGRRGKPHECMSLAFDERQSSELRAEVLVRACELAVEAKELTTCSSVAFIMLSPRPEAVVHSPDTAKRVIEIVCEHGTAAECASAKDLLLYDPATAPAHVAEREVACEGGDADACERLSAAFVHQESMRDPTRAFRLARRACDLDTEHCWMLSQCYLAGSCGQPRDPVFAAEIYHWMCDAAASKDHAACVELQRLGAGQ